MGIAIREARSALDFEYVRGLRNANRAFLTGDARRIGLLRQLRFWLRRPPSIDLYVAELDGRRCGYLLLRRDADTTWITEVVDARHRGRGVAQAMIRFAAARRPHLSAEILSANEASLRLHARAGFERVGTAEGRERHVLVPAQAARAA
ncbi:MAG: N-acetyltransferase family protein [Alphaproteobacteria bacterium]